jgi:hypothetical protein
MTQPASPGPADVLRDVELLDAPGGTSLRLRFQGPFEGRTVIWLATLRALAGRGGGGNYIEIGDDLPDGIPIAVGLQVPRIDLPTVRKAVIMIRRYKRLRRGRHDYGAAGGD